MENERERRDWVFKITAYTYRPIGISKRLRVGQVQTHEVTWCRKIPNRMDYQERPPRTADKPCYLDR